jgi:hypothetical protein
MAGSSSPRPSTLSRLLLATSLEAGTLRETIGTDMRDDFERIVEERSAAEARSWYRRQARRVVFGYALPKRLRRIFGSPHRSSRRDGTSRAPQGSRNPFDASPST